MNGHIFIIVQRHEKDLKILSANNCIQAYF